MKHDPIVSKFYVKLSSIRLHSRRKRTARALTVSPSMLCAGKGVSAPERVCSCGVSAPAGCLLPGGCLLLGRCLLLGGVCSLGVYLVWGVCSRGMYLVLGGQVLSPPVDRYTPVNILPCPKLLRAVIKIQAFASLRNSKLFDSRLET